MAQDLGRPDHVVVVLEGLALALEHHAGHRPLGSLAADGQDLLHDLPGLEVALETQPAGLAELAAEGAARLRRDADAPSGPLQRDPHRLEDAAVGSAEQVFDEGIDAAGPPVDDFQAVGAAAGGDLTLEAAGKPAHSFQIVPVLPHDAGQDAPGQGVVEGEVWPECGERRRGAALRRRRHAVRSRHGRGRGERRAHRDRAERTPRQRRPNHVLTLLPSGPPRAK